MSTANYRPEVALYIQRLKAFFEVKTDQELADKLGMSKQNIANWRRRGSVPPRTARELYLVYGVFYPDEVSYGEVTRSSMAAAYALLLHIGRTYLAELGRSPTPKELQRIGDSMGHIMVAIRGHIEEVRSPVRDTPSLIRDLCAEEQGKGRYYGHFKAMMEDDFPIPQ